MMQSQDIEKTHLKIGVQSQHLIHKPLHPISTTTIHTIPNDSNLGSHTRHPIWIKKILT